MEVTMQIFEKGDISTTHDVFSLNNGTGDRLSFRASSVSSISCYNNRSTNVKLVDGTEFNVRMGFDEASSIFMRTIDYNDHGRKAHQQE